ncbi:DNA polymerase III subunit beta [Paenibacillus eucommiae]|uniref:Beta sliding clamp n=1 Tax=Paenibacillus eucommiae TaxID=1355755 RepID=A0ABS4J4X6_9BACL|nr:DNA polymerase III subunit beta [Paenibacillus eucommiae]MBP1994896.1 DNA polymerase-3 subunit beta [Paenibacillus eucommiae]
MLIKISQKLLMNGLQYVAHAAATKNAIPILSGIKLEADRRGLTLTAGNLGMMLQYRIPYNEEEAVVYEGGSIVVPSRHFVEIIRNLPAGLIKLEIKGAFNLGIHSDNAVYHLCGADAGDYPQISELNLHSRFTFSKDQLKSLIRRVSFAVSTSEARPVLTGVMCHFSSEDLRLIATDGVRLSSQTTNHYITTELASTATYVIIPGKHLSDYAKMLGDEHTSTELGIGDNKIIFKSNNLLMQSLLIDGTYPSVDKVKPEICTTEIVLDTFHVWHALERVSLLAGESKVVKLQVSSTNSIVLTSQTAEIGDVMEEVPVEELIGDEITVHFNGRYMIEIMRAIDSKQVKLSFSGPSKPILVQPTDTLNSFYMITPIRSH